MYLNLATQISHRAEGIFLWAVFATRMLLISLGYDDNSENLFKVLEIIPEQLDALYEKLLASIGKHNRKQCYKMLYLTLMNPFIDPLNTVSYSWINDLDDPGFPSSNATPYSRSEIISREKFVERQLDKLTHGLLEIVEMSIQIPQHLALEAYTNAGMEEGPVFTSHLSRFLAGKVSTE
jgi:hypothetical protein